MEASISPSIFTILIWAHGGELPLEEFKDNDVRIVYLAGGVGSVFLGERDELAKIRELFDNVEKSNHKQLTEIAKVRGISKPKLMKELYAEFPSANTCQIIPNFSFDEDGNARPQSTFDFLQKYIVHSSYSENYREIVKRKKAHTANFEETAEPSVKLAVRDAETDQTHRLHTPVINKVYDFFDLKSVRPITDFGIIVLDTCNYKGPMKIGDDLTSKKGYNVGFKERFFHKDNERPTLFLSDIVGYMHSLGGKIINIIDMSCRSCADMNESFEGVRERITQLEHEENAHIDTAFGRKKYTKKERTKKERTKKERTKKERTKKTINIEDRERREKRRRKKKRKTRRKTRRKLN